MAYINSYKNQNWLIPQSIRDMIPKNHICYLVEDFVDSLDFSNFDMVYDGPGHPAYHPRIAMKIFLQGMLSKERSSRKLSNACRENFVFMYLSEKVQPNFRTLCRFRKDNADFIKQAFKETVKLASEHSLVELSLITQDGSKIKASANRNKVVKKESLEILDKVIDRMMEEDIRQDELDMELYGDKEENLTGMDRKDMKKIVQEYKKRKDKEKVRKDISKAKQEFKNNTELKKVSLTDIDLRMKEKMEKQESREIYNLRKVIAEPVIGDIKQNFGFREFCLRGLKKAKIELNLVSIAHNLKKIWINSGRACNVC